MAPQLHPEGQLHPILPNGSCLQMALYFCSGSLQDQAQFRHYALNVPLYTHFTSPIRRFPDVLVHRLLAAALGKGQCWGAVWRRHPRRVGRLPETQFV